MKHAREYARDFFLAANFAMAVGGGHEAYQDYQEIQTAESQIVIEEKKDELETGLAVTAASTILTILLAGTVVYDYRHGSARTDQSTSI